MTMTVTTAATPTATPTAAQAVSAWKLAHAFGHLWGTAIDRRKAVSLLTKGEPLEKELPADHDGYTERGIQTPSLEGGVYRHTSGSHSISWAIDRRGAVKAELRLRAEYPRPLDTGALFARVVIDPRTGRAEVTFDGLSFENHKGEWRFAPTTNTIPLPKVAARRDAPAAHAAGCLGVLLGAFGLLPPKHVAKVVAAYDAACTAVWDAANAV